MRNALLGFSRALVVPALVAGLGLSLVAGCDDTSSTKEPVVDTKAAGQKKDNDMANFQKNKPPEKKEAAKPATK